MKKMKYNKKVNTHLSLIILWVLSLNFWAFNANAEELPDLTIGAVYGFQDINRNPAAVGVYSWPHFTISNLGPAPVVSQGYGNVLVAVSKNPEFLNLEKYSSMTYEELLKHNEFWELLNKDLVIGVNGNGYSYGFGLPSGIAIEGYSKFDFWPPELFKGSEKHSALEFPKEGDYYVFVWVDYDNKVKESDETNNMIVEVVNIEDNGADDNDAENEAECEQYVVLEEGEHKVYALRDRNTEVEVLLIEDTTPPTVTLQIDGVVTKELAVGYKYDLNDLLIIVKEINTKYEKDYTEFCLSSLFGPTKPYRSYEDLRKEEILNKIEEYSREPVVQPTECEIECSKDFENCLDQMRQRETPGRTDAEKAWEEAVEKNAFTLKRGDKKAVTLNDDNSWAIYFKEFENNEVTFELDTIQQGTEVGGLCNLQDPKKEGRFIQYCSFFIIVDFDKENSVALISYPDPEEYVNSLKELSGRASKYSPREYEEAEKHKEFCIENNKECIERCKTAREVEYETPGPYYPPEPESGFYDYCLEKYEQCIKPSYHEGIYGDPNIEVCKEEFETCRMQGTSKEVPPGRLAECHVVGIRTIVDSEPVYCGLNYLWEPQKASGESAQNSWECESNFASNGACVNVEEQIGILKKLMGFFGKIFGTSGFFYRVS